MTVIAYRDGIMACDSQVNVGELIVGTMRKIVRSSCGHIAGVSGDAGDGDRFLEWVLEGGPDFQKHFVPHDPDFGAMFISPDGTVRRLGIKGAPYIISAPFHAMGIGREVAMGAMAVGASSVRAVEIAIEFMDGCGGPVQVEHLHYPKADERPGTDANDHGPGLLPPGDLKVAWHWLAHEMHRPFPALWAEDHWEVNGSVYCDRWEALRRGYRYVGVI